MRYGLTLVLLSVTVTQYLFLMFKNKVDTSREGRLHID